jgi:hypothetical protein
VDSDLSFDNNSFIQWNRWRLDEKEKKLRSYVIIFISISRYC